MTHRVLLKGKLFFYLPLLLLGFLFIPSSARAQDMFEIQVYPYETVAPRHTMFEFHMNFFPSGTKSSENGKYPVHHQFHFTTEITHGITEHFELAGYIVTAWAPEHGFKLAGARVRPRFRLPEKWRLPFKFSLSTEVGFNKHQFDANTITLELRPIIEKEFGKWYLSFNPDFSKSFKGEDSHEGFVFEPGFKASYAVTKKVEPGIEYYAETGPVAHFHPLDDQHHIIFGTVDFNTTPNWELNFGVGRGLTGSSEHWIVKWIVGYRFGF